MLSCTASDTVVSSVPNCPDVWLASRIETENCTVWPREVGGRLKVNCPMNVPPAPGVSKIWVEPRLALVEVSMAVPIAVRELLVVAHVPVRGTAS